MALLSKKEFAEQCGMMPSALSNAIRRKNVIVNDQKMIDTNDIVNASFLKLKLSQKKKTLKEFEDESDDDSNSETDDALSEVNFVAPDDKKSAMDLYTLNRQKLLLGNQKLSEEVEILNIKKAKLHGEVMPTDLVKMMMIQHTKSIVSAFSKGADMLIMNLSKKAGLNLNDQAELRGNLVEIINESSEEAITLSKKSIKNIVTEYSSKKGVGERA